MKEYTLVVMAAGMGSRFGGPKQITKVGPSGEFIIDYSIYDAIKAGFNKIVFVIKEEHRQIFKETIDERVKDKIKIEYVYQNMDNLPEYSNVPKDRTKPLGTAHAVLCAKEKINGPFAIINADDFYGRDAYVKAIEYLKENDKENEGAMIAYPLYTTTSKYGSVKRGVIDVEDGYVTKITECSITPDGNIAHCHPLKEGEDFDIEINHPVSMNLFAFNKNFMDMLEEDFDEFIKQESDKLIDTEIFLPDTAKKNIYNGKLKLKNIVSNSIWAGLTYKEDMEDLKEKITKLINNGEYTSNLWNN